MAFCCGSERRARTVQGRVRRLAAGRNRLEKRLEWFSLGPMKLRVCFFMKSEAAWRAVRLAAVCCLGFALAACGAKEEKKETAKQPEAKPALASAVPALELLPADADVALVLNNASGLLGRLTGGRVVREFLELPFIKKEAEAAGYAGDPVKWLNQALDRNPRNRENYELARDLAGSEVFVALPKGTAQQLSVWLNLYEEFQVAQLLNGLEPAGGATEASDVGESAEAQDQTVPEEADGKNPTAALVKALLPRLKPVAERLEIPALLLGCKPGGKGRAYLERRITSLLSDLPKETVRGEMPVAGGTLQTLEITFADIVPAEEQAQLRGKITEFFGATPEGAEVLALLDKALAKKAKAAFGFSGGRFVVAAGSPEAVAAMAQSLGGPGLGSRPEFGFAADYAGKQPFMALYQSREFVEACRPRLGLAPLAEASKPFIPAQALTGPGVFDKLLADAKRIDAEFQAVLTGSSSAAVGVGFVDSGLRIESRGGFQMPLLGQAARMKSLSLLDAGVAAYLGRIVNEQGQARFVAFVEDLCAAGLSAFKAFALPGLSEADRQNFAVGESLIVPRLQTLWGILKDLSMKALGPEGGIYADLQEPVPLGSLSPEPLRGEGRFPHIGLFSSVRDEKVLGEIWPRLMTWANEITMLMPVPGIERPLPQPESRAAGGAVSWFYRLPEVFGDDAPGVTIRDGFWFLGTSVKAQERLAAALKAPAAGESSSLHFEIRSAPLLAALSAWLDFAASNPEAMAGGGEPPTGEDLAAIRAGAGFAGRFESVQYRRTETPEGPAESLWIKLAR